MDCRNSMKNTLDFCFITIKKKSNKYNWTQKINKRALFFQSYITIENCEKAEKST